MTLGLAFLDAYAVTCIIVMLLFSYHASNGY